MQLAGRLGQQGTRLDDLGACGDHRQHHSHVAGGRGPQDGPELGLEKAGHGQADPDRTPAEKWVGFAWQIQVGGRLIATYVQRTDDHRPRCHGFYDLPVGFILLVLSRRLSTVLEQEFGAQEAHAFGPCGQRFRDACRGRQVGEYFHTPAIGGTRRLVAVCRGISGRALTMGRFRLLAACTIAGGCGGIRLDDDSAGRAVHGQRGPVDDVCQRLCAKAGHSRYAETARQDRRVSQRATCCRANRGNPPAVQPHRLRRSEFACHDHGVLRQIRCLPVRPHSGCG